METQVDVLLLEDNPGDASLVRHYLDNPSVEAFIDDITLTHVESMSAGVEQLESAQWDVLLLDLGLPESEGIETLHRVTEINCDVPVIVLTGLDNTAIAVEAIQSGAQDYLPKGNLDGDRLVRSLRYAIERHKQEQALSRRNEQLDFFNSLLRHDMMNGLNVMMARAEMLEKDLTDQDNVSNAQNIVEWGHNIVDLTDKIRSILDTVTSDDDASLESVSLNKVVQPEVDRVKSVTDRVEFSVDIPEETMVLANELLSDVIGNILTNSIEHTSDETSVEIDTEQVGPHTHLRISDDGDGIPEERRADLFERGQKGSTSTGSGFGLYFVSSMVDSYGGDVRVESNAHGGSTFVLELPHS